LARVYTRIKQASSKKQAQSKMQPAAKVLAIVTLSAFALNADAAGLRQLPSHPSAPIVTLVNSVLDLGDGLTIKEMQRGDEVTFPKKGDAVTVHYVGFRDNDQYEFANSLEHHKPVTFKVGEGDIFKPLDLAVMKMSLGESAEIFVPFDKYGNGGSGVDVDNRWRVVLLDIAGHHMCPREWTQKQCQDRASQALF